MLAEHVHSMNTMSWSFSTFCPITTDELLDWPWWIRVSGMFILLPVNAKLKDGGIDLPQCWEHLCSAVMKLSSQWYKMLKIIRAWCGYFSNLWCIGTCCFETPRSHTCVSWGGGLIAMLLKSVICFSFSRLKPFLYHSMLGWWGVSLFSWVCIYQIQTTWI
jgi:hypothetical protein